MNRCQNLWWFLGEDDCGAQRLPAAAYCFYNAHESEGGGMKRIELSVWGLRC